MQVWVPEWLKVKELLAPYLYPGKPFVWDALTTSFVEQELHRHPEPYQLSLFTICPFTDGEIFHVPPHGVAPLNLILILFATLPVGIKSLKLWLFDHPPYPEEQAYLLLLFASLGQTLQWPPLGFQTVAVALPVCPPPEEGLYWPETVAKIFV